MQDDLVGLVHDLLDDGRGDEQVEAVNLAHRIDRLPYHPTLGLDYVLSDLGNRKKEDEET